MNTSTADFLKAVYGHGTGFVHLTTTKRQLTAYPCSTVENMAELIAGKRDVFLSAAVVNSDKGSGVAGRIEDGDMAELTALWVDLDRAGEPGHRSTGKLWTRDDVRRLYKRLPVEPTAAVDSGGGWWFWWVLTDPVPLNGDGSGELLLARWARFWDQIAVEFDRQVDGVFNPSRIARAPGSINTKEGVDRPAVVKSLFPERRYTADQFDVFLPAPEAPRPTIVNTGSDDRPGDIYNREATVSTVVALLERHGFHSPRRKGGRVDLTRPGKNAKDGHSVTVWPDANTTFWSSSPEGQPGAVTLRGRHGSSGTYDPFGLYAHLEHGGDFQAAARALNPAPARLMVAANVESAADDDAFWDSRPELAHVRTYAHAQLAAPHAVLAVVLARVVCQTPPAIVLPDIIYSFASLNLSVALVADSGGGKGGSTSVGEAAVYMGTPAYRTHTLGTGQGIAHGYARTEKGATVQHTTSVMFTVEEVDHLAAHNNQTGSTTLAELRRFGMGEKLGALYVDPKRRVEVAAHAYRGAVIVAVQPARAGVLLHAADGGTPQRFYWTSTIDPNLPAVTPERPDPWKWEPPRPLPNVDRGLRPIDVCQTAADAIRQAQRERATGLGDPLDGHALLTRERLAAALGILNGRYEVSDEDWQLAGHLMYVSDTTRAAVIDKLEERTRQANRRRGEYDAERAVIVAEAVAEAPIQRVARNIDRLLREVDSMPRNELRTAIAYRDREHFDEALERAIAAGQVEAFETERGSHCRKVRK